MRGPGMRPPLDPGAFAKLRRIAPNQLAARRDAADWHAQPLPEEIAFKLSNRCDLRCTHCYQWNDDGYHHLLPRADQAGDLSLEVIAKVLEATRGIRSNVFLWGGEPLVYRHWDGLVDLLAAAERWTSICTNGTLVERRLPSLLRISHSLEMSLSIDGFETEHDALRGAGAFARTLAGLRFLVAKKRSGAYEGEISVNCVIGDALVGRLYDLVAFFEAEGVETVYLSFPWFISKDTAALMDAYFAARFPQLPTPEKPSWHSYGFKLDLARLDALRGDLLRVDGGAWRIKLRYNPQLDAGDLEEFLRGSHRPAQNKTRCLALRTRLDVFPNGDAVSCKFFPEFSVGNLLEASVAEVWHGERYDRVRETVATCGLMPVCAKCNLLYTRGA
ncbi:MAG: radical domain protein [bacterium]|nr:radical domain protein [bacterium]